MEETKTSLEKIISNLLNNKDIISFIEKHIEKPIEEKILNFLKDRDINEYINNPDKLINDLEKEIDILNIIDATFDTITIASLASIIVTLGGSLTTALAGLGAKTIFKLLLKYGLKDVIKKITKRLIRRLAPKLLLTTSTTVITEYTKRDILKNLRLLILIEAIIPIIELGKYSSIEVLKYYIINKMIGYDISQQFIDQIKKANDVNLIKNILKSQSLYLHKFLKDKFNLDLNKIVEEYFGVKNINDIIKKEKENIINKLEMLKDSDINRLDIKIVDLSKYKIPNSIKDIIKNKHYNEKYLEYIEENLIDFIEFFKDIRLIEILLKNIDYVYNNYSKFIPIIRDILNTDLVNIKKAKKNDLQIMLNKTLDLYQKIIIKNLERILGNNIDLKLFNRIYIDFIDYYNINNIIKRYFDDKRIV